MFDPFTGNYVWNLSTSLVLNTGGQVSEVADAIRPILPLAAQGDDATEAFLEAWSGLGDRIAELADEDVSAGHPLSAADKYARAAAYYITGERMQRVGFAPREIAYAKMKSAFARYLELSDERVEWVEIPYQGTSFPAILSLPDGLPGPVPVVVQVNGLDSTKEQMWGSPLRRDLHRRGYGVLMIDQPGTGEALRLRGLTAIPESERWASACIDWIETRDDLDADRIGIVGWSLGGYFAPRAAAFEKRFTVCVAWGANYDWGEIQRRRADREGENPVPHYWDHVQWVWGQPDFASFMAFASRVSLVGVVEQITVPFLVTHGAGDRQIPLEFAHRQYDAAVNSPRRQLKIFTEREGGIEHVSADNMLPAASFIADWIAETL